MRFFEKNCFLAPKFEIPGKKIASVEKQTVLNRDQRFDSTPKRWQQHG